MNNYIRTLRIGTPDPQMRDWIYGGYSPEDDNPLWIAPKDSPILMNFNQAGAYAHQMQEEFNAAGCPCLIIVPTKFDLNHVYWQKDKGALRGTFNETNEFPKNTYWSSSKNKVANALRQRFSDGHRGYSNMNYKLSTRLVLKLNA